MQQEDTLIEIEKFCPSCDRRFGSDDLTLACPFDGAALMPVTEDPIVGAVIGGKYEIGDLIGTGGWSKVYVGHHTQLDRVIAFKLLRADLVASAERIKRFDSEARLASGLSHPNICTVYDCGIMDSGQPYLILEHIEGKSLARLLQDEGSLDPARSVRLLKQIAGALEAAHERTIVHRDLKPGNIMVVGSGADEKVKIIDFGLAKAFAAEDREQLTHTGMTIGTPCYMSPEQVRGDVLDCRSDIYSFGCLAYEMLTGWKPVQGGSVFETMQGHLDREPRPMANAKNPIPQPLQDLTMLCLRKRPQDRYQTMADIERALTTYEKHGRIEKPKMGAGHLAHKVSYSLNKMVGTVKKRLSPHRRFFQGLIIANTCVLLAALLAMAFAPQFILRLPFVAQQQQPVASVKMQEFMRLRDSDDFPAAEQFGKDYFNDLVANKKQSDPDFLKLCDMMQRMLVQHGRHRDAVPYIEAAFKQAQTEAKPGTDDLLKAYANAANALLTIDDRDALPYLEKTTELTKARYGADSKEVCEPLYHTAWCRFRKGDAEDAIKGYKELLVLLHKYYPPNDVLTIRTLHRLSVVQVHVRRYADAAATCDQALPLISDTSTPGDLLRDLLQSAAHANQHIGNYDKAIALFKRALAVSEKVTVVQAEIIEADMGVCMVEAKQYKQAEPVLLDAMRRIASRWGPESESYQVCLTKFVEMLRATGDSKRADAIEAAGRV